jgi:hypothetical protein
MVVLEFFAKIDAKIFVKAKIDKKIFAKTKIDKNFCENETFRETKIFEQNDNLW